MPLDKSDAPANRTTVAATDDTRPATKAEVGKLFDAGAGAPAGMRTDAEKLPEKDDVQKAIKEGMLATDAQSEAKAKVKVVDASPDAADTPSGFALKKVAGISDDQKRADEYARLKGAKRYGYVPAGEEDVT